MKLSSRLLLLLTCFSPAVFAQRTAYFRNFSIDDRKYELKIKDSIDPAIASKTSCYQANFDAQNRISKIEYQRWGQKSMGNLGFSAVEINYTDSFEIRNFSYPADRRYQKLSSMVGEKIKLNSQGAPVEITHFNRAGKPVEDRYGVISYVRLLNKEGWVVEEYYLDANRNKQSSTNGDYGFRYLWESNDSCYIPTVQYFDINGKLHSGKRGYAVVRSWFRKSDRRLICSKYFDEQDKQVKTSDKYAYRVYNYYPNGLEKSVAYFDKDDHACCNAADVAKIEYTYNEFGNLTQRREYTKNQKHFMDFRLNYDKDQRLIEEKLFRDGNEPGELHGVSIIRYEYSPAGKLQAKHTFNKKNVSVLRTEY